MFCYTVLQQMLSYDVTSTDATFLSDVGYNLASSHFPLKFYEIIVKKIVSASDTRNISQFEGSYSEYPHVTVQSI